MISISLCLIVSNEEQTLARCLDSVKDIADEIVVVDTGSTDRTREIAEQLSARVIDFEWTDDFSAARNFSFSHATRDYILWLDADDVLFPGDREKLLELKRTLDPAVDAVSMDYHCAFDDRGAPVLTVRRYRLVKKARNFQWQGAVHEDLAVGGSLLDSDIVVTHKQMHGASDRNLNIYENMLHQGKPFTPQDIIHYARELHHHKQYDKAVTHYMRFMQVDGISAEDKILACGKLADCYYHLGDKENELAYTFKSFEYDVPRSEFCCRLGYHFLQRSEYRQAVYWYKTALETPLPQNLWAITNHPSRTWLPHLQLGHCYFRMNEYPLSYHYNQIALSYLPNDERILNNMRLLEDLLGQNEGCPV